jgi:hypothetical protein
MMKSHFKCVFKRLLHVKQQRLAFKARPAAPLQVALPAAASAQQYCLAVTTAPCQAGGYLTTETSPSRQKSQQSRAEVFPVSGTLRATVRLLLEQRAFIRVPHDLYIYNGMSHRLNGESLYRTAWNVCDHTRERKPVLQKAIPTAVYVWKP